MALKSTVLFGNPQSEIASLLKEKISAAVKVKITTGFVTVEGVKALEEAINNNPNALKVLVVGAGTYKAYEAFDQLIELGVPNDNLFVHLGHTRLTRPDAKHAFYRYHPMLHSKIYYVENADGTACAFVGSHNITGFALMGLNGEASIMLEGPLNDTEFEKIRTHINKAKNEAVVYQHGMKEAFSWWTNQFMEGLTQKTNDIPDDIDRKSTILLFCQYKDGSPSRDNILYFELPEAIGKIQSLKADVHVFVFNVLPDSPLNCLANLNSAKRTFWCSTEGIENNKGGKELSTDWYIEERGIPTLSKAPTPFRPTPKAGMQQIRVRLLNPVYGKFNYLFGKQKNNWLPVLDEQQAVLYNESFSQKIEELKLIPLESNKWHLVKGLKPTGEEINKSNSNYEKALKAMEPESGAFILFSTARRKIVK